MPGMGIGIGLNAARPTIVITPANNPGTAGIVSGIAKVGSVLMGQWDDLDGILEDFGQNYEQSNDGISGWTQIPTAYSSNYVVASALVGKYIRFTAQFADGLGNYEDAKSAPIGPVVP